jgi:hypothetical protein
MKDNRPSQGIQDMKKNITPEFEARLASADPAKTVKAPRLNQNLLDHDAGKKVQRDWRLNLKPRTALIGFAASALVVALSTTVFLQNQNVLVGSRLRALNIVLSANSQSSGNFGVAWHEGDVAAQYNYHLTGLDELDKSNSGGKIYLIEPDSNLESQVPSLLKALEINNPVISEVGKSDMNPATIYTDPVTHANLRVYKNGQWDYSNRSAKNVYGLQTHLDHKCGSPDLDNCTNSWKDILNLPTKESAFSMAMPLLKAGGYKGDVADISTETTTLGVTDGQTDLVAYKSLGTCELWNKATTNCISKDPIDTANRAAYFGVRFSSGGAISDAGGRFFQMIDLGSAWTKSAYQTISFLQTTHKGIAWLSSPTKPPAAQHRIDIHWDIQSATSGYSVMAGFDRDGNLSEFVMPSFYYIVDYGQSVPTQIILASTGTIEDPDHPESSKSMYSLPNDDTSPKCTQVGNATVCRAD